MNGRLKDYLRKRTPAKVDRRMFEDLRREMEKAVPEIADSIRARETLAAELRIAAPKASQADRDQQD